MSDNQIKITNTGKVDVFMQRIDADGKGWILSSFLEDGEESFAVVSCHGWPLADGDHQHTMVGEYSTFWQAVEAIKKLEAGQAIS